MEPGPVPIMIQNPRAPHQRGYWDDPVDKIQRPDAELRYLDFFDWNDMAYADFQYYRVEIRSFDSRPHLVGREALLEHQHARVFVDE